MQVGSYIKINAFNKKVYNHDERKGFIAIDQNCWKSKIKEDTIVKRMNLFVGMIMFVFVFGMFIENVEAVTLSNDNEKTYTFISTNGEFCSATVRASLTQKYTENGAIRSYTDRSGYIGYT